MKKITFTISILFFSICSFSQEEPILLSEQTVVLRSGETKELFYSFTEGDQIVFNLEMVKGKHIKEVGIVELPSNSVFAEFKSEEINDKHIKVRSKALYKFQFYNSAMAKRVCKVKIERIPINEAAKNFNTNWKWKTTRDTIYTPYTLDSITGYKTIKYQETLRELVKTKTIDEVLFDKTQRVHSELNGNGNLTYLKVDLPNPIKTELKEEKVIAWAYWIGVGEEAQNAYNQNKESIKDIATGIASTYGTPLAGIAVGTLTDLIVPNTGEDVDYSFIPNYENAQKYVSRQTYLQFDEGKGIAAYGKNSNRLTETFYIGLYNDNVVTPIDVNVKIVVIKEIKTFENKVYDREKREPIIVKLNKERMEIQENKTRVPVE